MTLQDFFQVHPAAALAFSGGADSAYLLWAAKACGADVQPYFVKTAFQPQFEYDDARRLCDALGVELKVLQTDILSQSAVAENSADRCYHCKRHLFTVLCDRARRDGYALVLDGTNASDDAADRPGMRALQELGVRSPLRECGLHKSDIRQLSKQAGLFTHDKPAYACLATRIATGQSITAATLEKAERSEAFLASLGFRDFRVRLSGSRAKIQLTASQLPLLLQHRTHILQTLKQDCSEVLLDLEVRNES